MANLISVDQVLGVINIHDGISAVIDDSFAAPGTVPVPTGATFTGDNLISLDYSDGVIFVHDGITAAILDSFNSPNAQPCGVAYAEGDLISSENWFTTIYVHDGISNAIKDSFGTPDGWFGVALAYDWVNKNLISARWSAGAGAHNIYVHDGISVTVDHSFAAPGVALTGLAFTGTNLLSFDANLTTVYVHDGISDVILDSFAVPIGTGPGITYDEYGAAAPIGAGWPFHDWAGD